MRDLAIIFRERLEHGIEGIDLNFEFKMASSTKCRTYSGRVMDVVFLISLTQTFSPTLLLPIPVSFVYMVVIVMCWFIALTFDGKTSL